MILKIGLSALIALAIVVGVILVLLGIALIHTGFWLVLLYLSPILIGFSLITHTVYTVLFEGDK